MNRQKTWITCITAFLALLFAFNGSQAADRTIYFHTDGIGSVVAATDQQGELLWREAYRPYGARMENAVATSDNTPFYTGKPHDDTTGLSYFGARYYDPEIGRFMGIDPVEVDPENPHSFNRYAYANNNPYRYVDPDGNLPVFAVAVFFAKELAGEVFEQATGIPAPTFKGVGKRLLKKGGEAAFSNAAKSTVQANKAAGEAFERQVMGQLQKTQSGVVQQVTVKTQNGVRTRIDLIGRDVNGNIACTECKASATARLTKNQAAAFPEIQQSGAVVVGKGKSGFPGGTQIPPTKVSIIRP